jgi:hypothetical protein
MTINGITISEEKLARLTGILSVEELTSLYEVEGLADNEIGTRVGLTDRDVCRIRKIYGIETDPSYGLRRNSLRFVPLTDLQKQYLHGSLFGDSCIAIQKSGSGYWRVRHCLAQEGYLLRQAELMKPFVAKVSYGERPFEKGGKLFPYVDARSYALPQFTELRNKFYPDGEKNITAKLLSEMTPVGFAFWFMDDGSCTGYGFDITTFDQFFRDTETASRVMKDTLGLSISVRWSSDGEGKVHILRDSHDKAWNYIEPYMCSDLVHKIPFKYRPSWDNQHPSLTGNGREGSTTGGSLNSEEYGDNTPSEEVILQNTPDTCENQVVIQSELVGNYERREEILVRA